MSSYLQQNESEDLKHTLILLKSYPNQEGSFSETPLPNNEKPSNVSTSPSDQEEPENGELLQDNVSPNSKKIKKISCRRDRYNVIPNDIRLALIDAVVNKGLKIKRAAAKLGINYSSAKSIFQVYKREGRADKKSAKKDKLKQTVIYKISPEFNFTNIALGKSSISLDQTPQKTKTLFSPFSSVKSKASFFSAEKPCLTDLDLNSLAEKLKHSENRSPCSTNRLTLSKNSSAGLEANDEESPCKRLLFSTPNKKSQSIDLIKPGNALSRPYNQEYFSDPQKHKDIQVPEFHNAISQHNLQSSSLDQNLSIKKDIEDNIPPLIPPLLNMPANPSILPRQNNGVRLGLNDDRRGFMEQQNYLNLLVGLEEQRNLIGALNSLALYKNILQLKQNSISQMRCPIQPLSFSLGH